MKRTIVWALAMTAAAVGFAGWDDSLAYQRDYKDVWRLRKTDKGSKLFFDPLCVVGGPSLTWARPADHVWHYGLWFSWKFINGVNYWEEKDGKADGEIVSRGTSWSNSDDGSLELMTHLAYRPRGSGGLSGDEGKVLTETRTILTSAPAEDGSYFMDWTMVFTALADVKLDRTPIPGEQGGQSWGGYAGLSMRFADGMKETQTISTAGRVTRNKDNRLDTTAAAMEQNGIFADGKPYGVAILAHPLNPRDPDWYALEGGNFNFFNAAFLLKEPCTLAKDETLVLRYRVHIHPGRWDAEQLKDRCQEYVDQPLKCNMSLYNPDTGIQMKGGE